MKKILVHSFIVFSVMFCDIDVTAKIQSFAVIGDAGHWNKKAQEVRDSILKAQVQKLILPGDNLYNLSLSYEEVWKNWSSKGLDIEIVAIGNHRKSYAEEIQYFKMPGEYYQKISGKVRFLVLNSDNIKNVDEQINWLKEKLAEAAPLFTVLVFHHPPATVSVMHRWEEKEYFQTKLRPLLIANSHIINVIVTGHDHQAQLFSFDTIPVVVSGAVWESRPTVVTNTQMEDQITITTRWINKQGHYWTRLDFNEEEKNIRVNFLRTDVPENSCTATLERGKAILLSENCSASPR